MNLLEATRAKLKCLEMVEGTGLSYWDVVKLNGKRVTWAVDFTGLATDYEFALGIVEGKPVWKGDRLWSNFFGESFVITGEWSTGYLKTDKNSVSNVGIGTLSWTPPKPKTVMVELDRETAEKYADFVANTGAQTLVLIVASAVRKALNKGE